MVTKLPVPPVDKPAATSVGRVTYISRFPVKSLGGETLSEAMIKGNGLVGDRRFAILDLETGNIASAKNPRKFAKLLELRAGYVEDPTQDDDLPPLLVHFPDGSSLRSDGAGLDEALSGFIGRAVRLIGEVPASGGDFEIIRLDVPEQPDDERRNLPRDPDNNDDFIMLHKRSRDVPDTTFFDLAPLHLVTTSSINHMSDKNPESNFDFRRFRPNIVIEAAEGGLVEDQWIDGTLEIGSGLSVNVTLPTPRCVAVTLSHAPDLAVDRDTIRNILKANMLDVPGFGKFGCLGVYADVSSDGRVTIGDEVCFRSGDSSRSDNVSARLKKQIRAARRY